MGAKATVLPNTVSGVTEGIARFSICRLGRHQCSPIGSGKSYCGQEARDRLCRNKPVWKKVPRWQAKEKGWGNIKPSWIDIDKGDGDKPNYRSWMVGKEFNDREVDGLFAATPPLESLRLILSCAATVGGGLLPTVGILIADVSRDFFEAPAKRDLCVELPQEALQGDETPQSTVGNLLASLYGARNVSANWQEDVAQRMREWGFKVCRFNPCMYRHESRKIRCLVHGDDFVSVGSPESLKWMKAKSVPGLKARPRRWVPMDKAAR